MQYLYRCCVSVDIKIIKNTRALQHSESQIKRPGQSRVFLFGGEGGIRTLDRDKPIHTFQACAFSRSATSPYSHPTLRSGLMLSAYAENTPSGLRRIAACSNLLSQISRTLDRDKPIHTFQACAFSRSATSPYSHPTLRSGLFFC